MAGGAGRCCNFRRIGEDRVTGHAGEADVEGILAFQAEGQAAVKVLAVGTELVEERQRASAIGLVYALNEGASTLSPLIGGFVAQAFGLRLSFLFYALLFAISTAIALILHRVSQHHDMVTTEETA